MISFWSQLRRYLLPTPGTITLLWGGTLVFTVLSALSAVASLDLKDMQMLPVIMGVSAIPCLIVPILVSALREPRAGPRAVLWLLLSLVLLAASLAVLIPLAFEPDTNIGGSLTLFFTCCLPPAVLAGLAALFFVMKSVPEMRRFLRAARNRRLFDMVDTRGETSFAEAGKELGLTPTQAARLLEELVASGDLMAYLDQETQRVYSASALAEKQRILLGVIQARGQMRLDELPAETGAPPRLVEQWLMNLGQRGQLHGYVDWQEGQIYSTEADSLRGKGECPRCGGELNLEGQGLIRCAHCGVEVFL